METTAPTIADGSQSPRITGIGVSLRDAIFEAALDFSISNTGFPTRVNLLEDTYQALKAELGIGVPESIWGMLLVKVLSLKDPNARWEFIA